MINFTFKEFISSDEADRHNINNMPIEVEIVENCIHTIHNLQKVRNLLANPIKINSGYRNPQVNKLVKGQPDSQHMKGEAADFVCPNYGSPYDICKAIVKSGLEFDQLIMEGTWVHISFSRTGKNRRSVLTKTKSGFEEGL